MKRVILQPQNGGKSKNNNRLCNYCLIEVNRSSLFVVFGKSVKIFHLVKMELPVAIVTDPESIHGASIILQHETSVPRGLLSGDRRTGGARRDIQINKSHIIDISNKFSYYLINT